MSHKIRIILTASVVLLVVVAAIPINPHTPPDVIATINTLRASYGLPPYAVDDLLMIAAQGQADYLASKAPNVGNGHVGPGGSDADARALAAGYPYVEGLDINENWAALPLDRSIESLIASGWSDDAHMHTMLHERGQHIGVGVSISGSVAYIIVDVAAYWGDAGLTPQPVNSLTWGSDTNPQVVSNYIAPVVLADPQDDGSIVHIVQSGQSLWMLGVHYKVEVELLQEINGLGTSDVIYIGQEILIQPPSPPTETPEPVPPTAQDTFHIYSATVESTPQPADTPTAQEGMSGEVNMVLLLFVTVFGIGMILVVVGLQQRRT